MLEKIDKTKIPSHIAIILDGNGRWATKRNKLRIQGHEHARHSIRTVVECAAKLNVEYLTLFVFSRENWNRPKNEVKALMKLLEETLNRETRYLSENNVILSVIGSRDNLSAKIQRRIDESIRATKDNTGLRLVLALNYSGRWDILNAVKKILSSHKNENTDKSLNDLDENYLEQMLSTYNLPEPELLIRTGGEKRISNFLLWQMAYTELYFTKTFWPDFNEQDFYEAIIDYQKRERRFGMTSEQITNKYD